MISLKNFRQVTPYTVAVSVEVTKDNELRVEYEPLPNHEHTAFISAEELVPLYKEYALKHKTDKAEVTDLTISSLIHPHGKGGLEGLATAIYCIKTGDVLHVCETAPTEALAVIKCFDKLVEQGYVKI